MDIPNYGSRIVWSDEDAAYIATCAELEGLSGVGDSQEQALAELRVAIELALEEYDAAGQPWPAVARPAEYSGQFRLRLPKKLHALLAEQAEAEGVSLNALALSLLSYSIGDVAARAHACKTMTAAVAELQGMYTFYALPNAGIVGAANSLMPLDAPWSLATVNLVGGESWQN